MSNSFQKVLQYFTTLTTIPRGSSNREGIREFLCNFAQEHGLPFRSDAADNVIITKPGAAQYAHKAPVILQGHTDMVCATADGVEFDFAHEALRLKTQDGFLFAEGTSLGADDGIAMAMMLALLDSDIVLPPIECIFTSDEEIGMIGACALDMSDIQGQYLINVDSEDEGVLTVSCAGGSTATVCLPVHLQALTAERYSVEIAGLAGGHSGVEIIRGGLNANKLLGEVLECLSDYRIVEIGGGEKENAIAARAHMTLAAVNEAELTQALEALQQKWKKTEAHLCVTLRRQPAAQVMAMDADSSARVRAALCAMPQGITQMSAFDTSAVQTSLNLGVLEFTKAEVRFTFSVRSSISREREKLEQRLKSIAESNKGSLTLSGVYPGWEYREDSRLRDTAVRVFEHLFSYTPKIESIHAGLECGVLLAKKPELDCISLGPQLYDVHTARERLSLASAERTWQYLIRLIQAL